MAQQTINTGTSPNDGAGDPLQTAFIKCNDNFTELYNADVAGYSNISNGTSNVKVVSSGGNVTVGIGGTGNVAVFATTGEYITGLMSVTGNVQSGNLSTVGLISATGNITGGNVLGGANVNATSLTGTTVSVTGNITGGNVLGGANVNATSLTGTTVSVSGNITGGNLITGALAQAATLSATGAVTFSGTTTNQQFGTSLTTGVLTLGAAAQTGTLTLGQSTDSQTTNIQTGATATAKTKAINLGVGGLAGSTTTIAIGPVAATTAAATATFNTATTVAIANTSGTALSVAGNITGGNVLGGANVNATTHTGTTVSVSGNITGGNVLGGANVNATSLTGTTVSVSGNITGGNVLGGANVNATSLTGTTVSVSGNVTGGNIISGGNVGVGVASPTAALEIKAGNATVAPFKLNSGTNLTSPVAGVIEYDGNAFYSTDDVTGGRGYIPSVHYFRLTSDSSTTGPGIANYFGATSGVSLDPNVFYELEANLFFTKTTAATVTFTTTFTQAPVNNEAWYVGTPTTGVGTVGAPQTAAIVKSTATAGALPLTGSLSDAVNHQYQLRGMFQTNVTTGGTFNIQITSGTGTVTPLTGSYYKITRLPSANSGTFV